MNNDTISEDKFWKIIEEVNYSKDFDHSRICLIFSSEKYGNKEQFIKIENKYNEILKKTTNYIGNNMDNISVDEVNNLSAHIIGMGEKTYKKVFKNIITAQTIYDNNEIPESFSYSFHAEFGIYWSHFVSIKTKDDKKVENITDILREKFLFSTRKKNDFFEDVYTYTLKELKEEGKLPCVSISDVKTSIEENLNEETFIKNFATV